MQFLTRLKNTNNQIDNWTLYQYQQNLECRHFVYTCPTLNDILICFHVFKYYSNMHVTAVANLGTFLFVFFHYGCFPTDFFSSTNNWSSKPHYHFGVFVCLIHSMNFCWKTSFLILFFNKLIKLEFITFILKFIRNFLSHLFSNGIFVLFISICSGGVFFTTCSICSW